MSKSEAITWTQKTVKLGDLIPWDDNPKTSTKKDARALLKSWDELGQFQTIAIGPGGDVYDGHQRLSALLTVHGADYAIDARVSSRNLTDEERRKIALYSRQIGAWDTDKLANWSPQELTEWGGWDSDLLMQEKRFVAALDNFIKSEQPEPIDAEPQIDRAEELRVKWQVEIGQMWQIGEHRLICGDCTDASVVARVMGGERADMVWTDPPYGVDYEGGAGNENKREKLQGDESGDLYAPGLLSLKSACKKGAPMYVWFADRGGKPVYDAVQLIGYEIRAMIIWNKLDAHYGAFMAQYMQKHEPCLYIVDGNSQWIGPTNEITVWDVKQPNRNEFHPTEKPLDLSIRAIKNHNAPIVADFFGGSGTALMACENLGRRCMMIEKEPKFCAVTLERWSTATGKTPVLMSE